MEKTKIFTILVAIFSLVGIILLFADYFGGFWYGYYSSARYSCLSGCEYYTPGDLAAQILGVILLALEMLFAINNLIPKPFLKKLIGMKVILLLGLLTVIMMTVGAITFGVTYAVTEVWFGAGFYGGLFAGILITVLAILSLRLKK